ncbi:MAG: hypothetical protein HC880_22145, partial [Bacteroidia bacterium]|nr:hypothetical protein [Bacteroidia bacterium]
SRLTPAVAWPGLIKNAIKGTTYDLIDQGIPGFFAKEFESLSTMIHDKLIDLGNSPFNTTNFIALNAPGIKGRIDSILKNEKLLRKTRQLSDIILEDRIFKIPLHRLSQNNPAELVRHIQDVLDPEIDLVRAHLHQQIQEKDHLDDLVRPLTQLVQELMHRHVLSLRGRSLVDGVEEEHWHVSIKRVVWALWESPSFKRYQAEVVPAFLDQLKNRPLGEILDLPNFKASISEVLTHALENPSIRSAFNEEVRKLLETSLQLLNQNLTAETKDFVIHNASQAIFGALEKNILLLINAINFKDIVIQEIEKMHPKQLERLFYGFARRYFKYLIGYGFIFGIIFGLAIDFGILSLLSLLE